MRLGIHGKLMILYLAFTAILIAVGGVFTVESVEKTLVDELERDLAQKARVAAAESLKSGDPDRIADDLGRILGVRVTFVGPDGKVLGDSEIDGRVLDQVENHASRPEIRTAISSGYGVSRRRSMTLHNDLLYVAVRIEKDGRVLGVSRVALSLQKVDQYLHPVQIWLALSGLVWILLAVLLSFVMSRLAARPVTKLTEIARSLAAGNLTLRTRAVSTDEVGDLGRALDHLAATLEEKIEDLRKDRDLLAAIIQGMSEGVLVADGDGRVLMSNPALRRIFRIEPLIEGKPVIEVLRQPEIQSAIVETEAGQHPVEREVSIPGLDPRTLLIHAARLDLKAGPPGIVMVFHDITSLRRLETVRKDFVANVSHELRTPVAAIRSYAETLLTSPSADPARSREFIEVIDKHSKRLSRLIEDLLELSSIESSEFKVDLGPVDVRRSAHEALSVIQPLVDSKRLQVSVEIHEKDAFAQADKRALDRVLLNLVDNAAKYTPDHGRITITARPDGDKLLLSVTDTGIGIEPKHFPRLFERFYRVDAGRSRDLGGTGLGLAIVKHLVLAMNGSIDVQSRPGEGSTFTVTLRRSVS